MCNEFEIIKCRYYRCVKFDHFNYAKFDRTNFIQLFTSTEANYQTELDLIKMELLFRSFTALNQAGRISSCRFALLCPAQVSHSKFGFATITVDSKVVHARVRTSI